MDSDVPGSLRGRYRGEECPPGNGEVEEDGRSGPPVSVPDGGPLEKTSKEETGKTPDLILCFGISTIHVLLLVGLGEIHFTRFVCSHGPAEGGASALHLTHVTETRGKRTGHKGPGRQSSPCPVMVGRGQEGGVPSGRRTTGSPEGRHEYWTVTTSSWSSKDLEEGQ